MAAIFHFSSDLFLVKMERHKEPIMFPASLAKDRIYELYLMPGVNLSPDRGFMARIFIESVHPFIVLEGNVRSTMMSKEDYFEVD